MLDNLIRIFAPVMGIVLGVAIFTCALLLEVLNRALLS